MSKHKRNEREREHEHEHDRDHDHEHNHSIHNHDSEIVEELRRIVHIDQHIAEDLDELVRRGVPGKPTSMAIVQITAARAAQGDHTMAIKGIVLGATGTFQMTPLPTGSVFPSGTTFTWTSDDTLTSLTPSADGTGVAVATTTGDTATSFNLTCTSSFTPPGASAPVSKSVNVPLTGGGGGGNTPSDMSIDQVG